MTFKSLEFCLSSVEKQIIKPNILKSIDSLKNSLHHDSFLVLKDLHDIPSILDQAICSHSPLRASSLLCLQIVCSDDSFLIQKYFLRLVESLYESNLYDNALEIINRFKTSDYKFLTLGLSVCYKVKNWQLLLQFFDSLPKASVTDDLKLIVSRALLEQNRALEAYSYLLDINSDDHKDSSSYFILLLTIKQKLGQLNAEDFNQFLVFISNASHLEKSALAGLWPTFEFFLSENEFSSNTLSILLNNFWYSISINTLLADGFTCLPSLVNNNQIKRIAFSATNIKLIPILESLVNLMQENYHNITSVDIIYFGDDYSHIDKNTNIINLSGMSMTAIVHCLRELNIDVLVDTIGPSNSRWLEILAQRVSSQQLGWFSLDLASFFAPFYDYLIIDRWTKPSYLNNFPIKLLEFSGIVTLSDKVFKDDSLMSTVVHSSVDTFLILGSPDQLFPGSQQLIRSLLVRYPNVSFKLIDSVWEESGLLDYWWSSVYTNEVSPTQLSYSKDLNESNISQQLISSSLILSFSQGSPTYQLSYFLSKGIPIVCLASATVQSRSILALLYSLGLDSFIAKSIENFNDIIDSIMIDSELRTEIVMKLPHIFKTSLTLNHQLFVSDLYQSLSLLSR